MELRQLNWLIATAEAGSISAAAREGHISQPALSVAIAQLERELQVPLLARSRDGVRLTEAGRAVADVARRILQEAQTVPALARAAAALSRPIRIGMIDHLGGPALAAGVTAACSAGIELQFVWGHRPWDSAELSDEQCELAVIAAPITAPGVHGVALHVEPRGILVGPASPLFDATSADVTFEVLSGHPTISPVGPPQAWQDYWSYTPQLNGQRLRRIGPEVRSLRDGLAAVMTTPGMMFAPRRFGLQCESFGVRYIEVPQGPPSTHLLAWREPVSAPAEVFISAVMAALGPSSHSSEELHHAG